MRVDRRWRSAFVPPFPSLYIFLFSRRRHLYPQHFEADFLLFKQEKGRRRRRRRERKEKKNGTLCCWIRVETALLKREYKEVAILHAAAAAAVGGWIEREKKRSVKWCWRSAAPVLSCCWGRKKRKNKL